MVEKEAIERYIQVGLEKGHSLDSLRAALLEQGVAKKELKPVVNMFRKQARIQKKQAGLEELRSRINTNAWHGKIRFHVSKYPYHYAIAASVVYVALMWVQAAVYWAPQIITI